MAGLASAAVRQPAPTAPLGAPGRRGVLRRGGMALAGIVLLGAAVRFSTLGVQSFSDDELFTTWLVNMPFGDMISTIRESEATPYLFYALEWVSTQLFGHGEVGMRILPAAAGTLTVPAIYAAGALGASRRVGLAAAIFAAVNPLLVWFSQEARAYSVLVLLVAVSLASLVAYEREGGRYALVSWAVVSAAALATHYFAVFLIAPEVAWLLLAGPGDRRRRLAAAAVPAVAGLALLPLALSQRNTISDPGGIGNSSVAQRAVEIPKNFLVGLSIPAELLISVAAAAAGATALVLAWRSSGDERRLGAAMAALAACGLGIPLLLTLFGLDYLSSRNVISVLVPLALVLGCGFVVGRIGGIALAGFCVLAVGVTIAVAAAPQYQRRDWRGAAHALGPARGERALIFSPGFSNLGPFRIYFDRDSRFLRSPTTRVEEVAVVALPAYQRFTLGPPEPPKSSSPSPPPGFRLAQDVRTSTFRLVRFRAARATAVTARRLAALAFPGLPAVYLRQSGERH